mmetsp:Transcript_38282/g.61445  ORF Transcript_38282/g.61445 Transcript_38282/m.61445 type:complete len:374 (-) Transcript_38282:124-1245(-)|eukprot:jgi/Bigna1/77937/fgenesh1_pg.51_\
MRLIGERPSKGVDLSLPKSSTLRVWISRGRSRLAKALKGNRDHLVTAVLIVIWYSAAVMSNISSKTIMSQYKHPSFLVLLQLLVNVVLNGIVLSRTSSGEESVLSKVKKAAPLCLPSAVTLMLSRILTYFSFSKVPASLTQTIKASSPVFTVLLSFLLRGNRTRPGMLVTLIPIIIGVTLSTVTELEFEFLGFVSALLAAFISTLQTFATKDFLAQSKVESSPLLFNLTVSLMASVVLLPANIYQSLTTNASDSQKDEERISGSLVILFIVSVLMNWCQTISSIHVLKRLSLLSHQVISVMRRLLIIVTSLLYFRTEITTVKILGILTAIGGFGWYSFEKKRDQKKAKVSPQPVASSHASFYTDCNNKMLIVV